MVLPQDFITEIQSLLRKDEFDSFLEALSLPTPVSIRINPDKADVRLLGYENYSRVPWCSNGIYLNQRPSFTMDPLFHAGAYYVQEASSMFISHLLHEYVGDKSVNVLDLCAAPGGKTTLMLSCLSKDAQMIANEVVPKRAKVLLENITKWGSKNVVVTNNRPEDFRRLSNVFDLILCDVPCSGEGLFRKDEESIKEWSLQNVEMCASRQRTIVESIWDCLCPGGLLVYSTCTYNTKENEENVKWISLNLGADILPCRALPEWNIIGNLLDEDFECCHFFPHKQQGEGFFCAVLRKHDPTGEALQGRNPVKITDKLIRDLRIMNHENKVSEKPVATVDVDLSTAQKYLHGDVLTLSPEIPKGYVLITYRNLPLGYAKNVVNRANNLYPKEWRIRKQI